MKQKMTKVSEALYEEVKTALEPRMVEVEPSVYAIAREFGLSDSTVWKIKHSVNFFDFRPGYREPKNKFWRQKGEK